MSDLEIIVNQIQSDLQSTMEDLEQGISSEMIIKDLIRINEKIDKWKTEINEMENEAKIEDDLADSQPEFFAERLAEEHAKVNN